MKNIIAAASFYKKSYFYNEEDFSTLPFYIKKDVQAILTEMSESLQGISLLGFDEDGNLKIKAQSQEDDYNFDELRAKYMINSIIEEEGELLKSIELWYTLLK